MSTKTADEIRDLFSDALEGELPEAAKQEFDAALAQNTELNDEYEAFRSLFRGTAAIANTTEAETEENEPKLLRRVQERLHRRSKGRFYRDRFSRGTTGRSASWLMLILVLLVLMIGALALQNIVVIESGPAPHPPPTPAGGADS